MNDFLVNLMELKNKISKDGWLILSPTPRDDQLAMRVEWYLDKKYSFGLTFDVSELNSTKVDLAKYFIEMANSEIELMVNKEQQK